MVGKSRKCWIQIFSTFSAMFSRALSHRVIMTEDNFGKRLDLYNTIQNQSVTCQLKPTKVIGLLSIFFICHKSFNGQLMHESFLHKPPFETLKTHDFTYHVTMEMSQKNSMAIQQSSMTRLCSLQKSEIKKILVNYFVESFVRSLYM